MANKMVPRDHAVIFVIDQDAAFRRLATKALLGRFGETVEVAEFATPERAEARLASATAVILDLGDVSQAGLAPLMALKRTQPNLPVLALSSGGSMQAAIEATRAGADEFLVKPVKGEELARRLSALFGNSPLAREPAAKDRVRTDFEGFVGSSANMRAVYAQIERIAPSRAPVFISGESGTGKEVTAEAIHRRSGRGAKPFIALNCGAIPKDLMESELFGHVRGAFTGAGDDRAGAAELADGGTLFLDELCELDLTLQSKLLRFVQTGTIQRVGDARARAVDVRIISATNRDAPREVEARRFRLDLFYRLNVLPVHLPPLRERRADVLELAEAFLERISRLEGRHFAGLDQSARDLLIAHDWPGNVRELENMIHRAVVMNDGEALTGAMLTPYLTASAQSTNASVEAFAASNIVVPLWLREKQIIETTIDAFGGHVGKAAAALEISPSTIYRKRQEWHMRAAG